MFITDATGEWNTEPDRLEFQHSGFDCLITRHPELRTLNGYIRIPSGHPAYKIHYDELEIEAHGGITYADNWNDKMFPGGRPQNEWWIGFDCAHAYDLVPAHRYKMSSVKYKNIEFVTREIKFIIEQLRNMKPPTFIEELSKIK